MVKSCLKNCRRYKIFAPLIHDFLSISELKTTNNHRHLSNSMIENIELQVGNANVLSFPTSHYLLRSVEDKANKSCLKNGGPYTILHEHNVGRHIRPTHSEYFLQIIYN